MPRVNHICHFSLFSHVVKFFSLVKGEVNVILVYLDCPGMTVVTAYLAQQCRCSCRQPVAAALMDSRQAGSHQLLARVQANLHHPGQPRPMTASLVCIDHTLML